MKRTLLLISLATLWTVSFASQDGDAGAKPVNPPTGTSGTQTAADGLITITSKGKDVREVLTDIFVQAKKNFVIDKVAKQELFLNLANIDIDETLEIICKLASLRFDVQNGIYYFTKVDPAKIPAKTELGSDGATGSGAAPTSNGRLQGRLSDAVLTKKFTTRMSKVDFREVIKSIGRQTDVWVEVAPDVDSKKVDAFMINLTLKQGLDMLTDALGLQYRFTDNQSILIYKASPNRITILDK